MLHEVTVFQISQESWLKKKKKKKAEKPIQFFL